MRREDMTSPNSKNADCNAQDKKEKPKSITIPHYSDKYKEIIAKAALTKNYIAEYCKPVKEAEAVAVPEEHSFFFFRVRSIGVGAHSFVYLVQDEKSKMLLAQKSITKEHSKQIEQDLVRQAKLLFYLCHDNVIKLYHIYATQTHVNFVMEFAEDSLFALKQKFGTFKEKEIIEIVRQLLLAVQYLHSQHIVHADIKLENIMIANGTIKLCDFGLAHRHDKYHLEATNTSLDQQVVGTLEYLPPQYAQGTDSGPARDIWAVGILAYELAIGRHPFQGMKENQKWAKLVKNPPSSYYQELESTSKSEGVQLKKVQELLRGIFLPWQQRWSAQKLLHLGFFNTSSS